MCVKFSLTLALERVQIFISAEGLKIEFLRSGVHFDFAHLAIHMI